MVNRLYSTGDLKPLFEREVVGAEQMDPEEAKLLQELERANSHYHKAITDKQKEMHPRFEVLMHEAQKQTRIVNDTPLGRQKNRKWLKANRKPETEALETEFQQFIRQQRDLLEMRMEHIRSTINKARSN